MFNGEIVSYVISNSPNMKMVMTMFDKAFKKRDIHGNLIFHSDQGWQYQHKRYQTALEDRHIAQSMSRKGNCLDNAMMETSLIMLNRPTFGGHIISAPWREQPLKKVSELKIKLKFL